MLKEWDRISPETQEKIFEFAKEFRNDEDELNAELLNQSIQFTVMDFLNEGLFDCRTVTYDRGDSPTEFCNNVTWPGVEFCETCQPDY